MQSGESDRAAAREVEEELSGIAGRPLELLFVTAYDGPETRARIAVYRVIYDGPLTALPGRRGWSGATSFPPRSSAAGCVARPSCPMAEWSSRSSSTAVRIC